MVEDNQLNQNEQLDQEWIALILSAKEIGIPISEIRDFLQRNLQSNRLKLK